MFKIIGFSLVVLSLISCGDKNVNDGIAQRLEKLESDYSSLKSKVELNELMSNISSKDVVYLRPGNQGYSVISFDLGDITIKIDNVSQYAGGVKLTFQLGNPLFTNINGLKADVEYGEVDEKGLPKDAGKSKNVKFEGELKAGSWGKSSVVLEGIELNKFGYIRVKNLSHTQISLRN